MKMKEVVQQTGIPERTIRFYEERGMLDVKKERRNGRNYHEFTQENVEDLQRIVTLRQARFSLDEILAMKRMPKKIGEIVETNLRRLEGEQKQLSLLTQNENMVYASDWKELSQQVEAALRSAPDYQIQLRFGWGDPESPQEKEAAIAAHRKNQKLQEHRLTYLFLGLSVFFFLLALIFGVLLYDASRSDSTVAQQDFVPEAQGLTGDYLYYRLDEGLARCHKDGGQEELIYKTKNIFQFLLSRDKIFILDGTRLFSINADGSGIYEYAPGFYEEYLNQDPNGGVFLLGDDSIFILEGDDLGNRALVRVPMDGSTQEKLDIDLEGYANLCCWVWDDILYVFRTFVDMTGVTISSDGLYSEILDYNLEQHEVSLIQTAFSVTSAQGLYFDNSQGYFVDFQGNLIWVTAEYLSGEGLKTYEDEILAMYGDTLLLTTEEEGVPSYYMENIHTGATTPLPQLYGTVTPYLNFTENGLRVGSGIYAVYP